MAHHLTRPDVDHLWNDDDYRQRISALAAAMHMPWPMTTSMANVVEYRAHLVLFRMYGGIEEWLFTEGMKWATAMEERIALKAAGRVSP